MAQRSFRPVKHPGAATRSAKRAGQSLTTWARKNYHAAGRKGKRARFIIISRNWRKGKRSSGRR